MASPPRPPDIADIAASLAGSQFPPPDKQFGTIPAAPPPPPYPGYMSPQDLLAAATKAITDAYAPQLAYLQNQQRTQQQRNAAQQAGLVELYKILAGSMSGLGGDISGIYNQGASDIGKYTQGVVSNDLPMEQAIVSSGAAQGPGYGSAYPQLAGQQGQTEFLKAVQDANQQEGDVASQIQQLIAQEPEKVQSLLQQLQGQQADYAKAAQPIIRSVGGAVVAIDPLTGKTQVLYKGSGAAGRVTIRNLANGQLQAFDAAGNPVGKPYGPTRPTNPSVPQSKTLGGKIYQWDPKTQSWYDTGVGPGVTTKPTAPAHGQAITTQSGQIIVFHPDTGIFTDQTGKRVNPNAPAYKTPPNKPTGTPTGSAPRRGSNGVWTTASGRVLGPAGQRYWEKQYQQGRTDGRGSKPKSPGSAGGAPPFVKPKGKGDAAAEPAAYTGTVALPANASSEFATVDAEGAPDASGTRHHAAYDWMLGPNKAVPSFVDGVVVEAKPSAGDSGQVYGGTVKVQMANGEVVVYRHVNPNVKVGQRVRAGQTVASVVRWRDNPSSSHTHIELWRTLSGGYHYENMLDPLLYFRPREQTV